MDGSLHRRTEFLDNNPSSDMYRLIEATESYG